jgi:hypothetical protein
MHRKNQSMQLTIPQEKIKLYRDLCAQFRSLSDQVNEVCKNVMVPGKAAEKELASVKAFFARTGIDTKSDEIYSQIKAIEKTYPTIGNIDSPTLSHKSADAAFMKEFKSSH